MHLFKRALLSLFPDEIGAQNMNPASMFVSFISTKEFFSVINRKIVENYKLNLFDISLDPFEFKTGFGDNPQIKQKDNDLYYGYCSAANLNGHRFLNCANISNCMTLVASIYSKDLFIKYGEDAYLNFLYTVFLLGFVFTARLKVFPYETKNSDSAKGDNYNRFIDLFFNFYEFVFSQTGKKITQEQIWKIKKDLLNEGNLFFLFFMTYKKCNGILTNQETTDKNLYSRLFYDELKEDQKGNINEFIENSEKYCKQPEISTIETKILQFILPADILIRYLFLDTDMFLVTETIISKIYDRKILDKFMKTFHKNDEELENFILYITDYKNFKRNFFWGVQKYLVTALRETKWWETDEELDDLMSSIGDDIEHIENLKIPERIKKESRLMEKILNFYITLVGWFWIARGDNFFLRLFRSPIIKTLSKNHDTFDKKNHNLYYYGSLLYNYGKNVFYYKYASENVRAGKQKFFLPFKSNHKNIYSNISILKLFDENFIATILQDINPKDIRIFVKNKKLLDTFRMTFGKRISTLVQKDKNWLIKDIYAELWYIYGNKNILLKTLIDNLTTNDVYHIKENIYNLDFWIAQELYTTIIKEKIQLETYYSDNVLFGILANFRETLQWFLLYITFLSLEENKQDNLAKNSNSTKGKGVLHNEHNLKIQIIKRIYITDILNINTPEEHRQQLTKLLDIMYDQFKDILEQRISVDDNKDFLRVGMENRSSFVEWKKEEEIIKKISWEDIIRFRWFLKNITYYNKRFLIPK